MVKVSKNKTGRKSAVETSPFRKEIEEMLREGKSPDFISTYLKTNGESISRSAIYRYKRDKFNIQSEAVQKYNEQKSKQRLDEASNDLVNDLQIIDKNIIKVNEELDISKMNEDQKSRFLTNLLNTKAKYLGLDRDSVEVNVENNAGLNKLFNNDKIRERLNEKRKRKTAE